MTSVSQRVFIEMLIHPVCGKALNECFCRVSSNCFLRIEYFQIMVNEDPVFNIIKTEKYRRVAVAWNTLGKILLLCATVNVSSILEGHIILLLWFQFYAFRVFYRVHLR